MPKGKKEMWFENWFDSPYYHILYKQRNISEAEVFIDNLVNYLHPKHGSRFLDIGCGKGRHSIYLNEKGYNVTGIDLSEENIAYASQFENKSLKFHVEDMRKIAQINQFDYALNLFTSFGYFENEIDDYTTLNAIKKSLFQNGIFVLDFMNTHKVLANLVLFEVKIIDNIEFEITKSLENNFIVKRIHFQDKGIEYNFQERVKALMLTDFKKYFNFSKLKILNLLGNYNLEEFNQETSNRLIIIAQALPCPTAYG